MKDVSSGRTKLKTYEFLSNNISWTDDTKENGAIGFYLSDSDLILVILNFNKNIFSFVVLLIFL